MATPPEWRAVVRGRPAGARRVRIDKNVARNVPNVTSADCGRGEKNRCQPATFADLSITHVRFADAFCQSAFIHPFQMAKPSHPNNSRHEKIKVTSLFEPITAGEKRLPRDDRELDVADGCSVGRPATMWTKDMVKGTDHQRLQ
ncbi:hypothetical protein EVAR_22829_1 [Eumeta japonica]|uniref:Uncharacterized protein n=1 Tax=Eumeta variegata TaxID=151549 RepID=A0A4C1VGD4_EUMVA|nr:hypothetical protein EVAR_22829_1 [Eumeta japonica]